MLGKLFNSYGKAEEFDEKIADLFWILGKQEKRRERITNLLLDIYMRWEIGEISSAFLFANIQI